MALPIVLAAARAAPVAWGAISKGVSSLSPALASKAELMLKKVSPGATLTSMFSGKSDDKKIALEMLAKSGYDMKSVDLMFRAFGVAERAELMGHVSSFIGKEMVANDAVKTDINDHSYVAQAVLYGQVQLAMDVLCIKRVDDFLLVSNVLNQLTSKVAAEYKAAGALNPKLGYF